MRSWFCAQLFFEHQEDQEAFVAEMKEGHWLSALRLPPELHRVLTAQLRDTWYIDGNPGTTLYSTKSGTSPGSPVADTLFAFLFSRFLRGMEAFIRDSGVSPHVAVHRSGGTAAEAPTWADDVVILFTSPTPADVPNTLAAIGEQVITRLRRLGLTANLGSGKTEAVVSIRGRDSRRVRRALLAADTPSVPLSDAHGPLPSLRVVPNYVHLGTLLNAELSEVPNLQRRAQLLYAAFKPIRNKLLSNPYLHFHEKRELILSRVIPCFMHGSGLWRLSTMQEQEAATGPLCSVLRRCVRPLTGKSAAHLTQAEVVAALDIPAVEELLHVNQIRALAQVLRQDMQPSWPGFQADGVWLRQACAAARKILPSKALDTLLSDGTPSDLQCLARHFADQGASIRGACRRYLRKCRAGRPPVDWTDVLRRQEQEDSAVVVSCTGPTLTFPCPSCGNAFTSRRRLSVHLARHHGQPGRGRGVTHGTACQVCRVEFWSAARLSAHLSRSDVCFRTYSESDIPPEVYKDSREPAWKPCAKFFGPAPFWATLRP